MDNRITDILAALKAHKLAYSIDSLQQAVDVGRSTIYEELNAKRLVAKKCDKITLVPVWEAVLWLLNLPDYVPGQQYVSRPRKTSLSQGP